LARWLFPRITDWFGFVSDDFSRRIVSEWSLGEAIDNEKNVTASCLIKWDLNATFKIG
jgi:hypothetical protein